jgi:hypothetical protein
MRRHVGRQVRMVLSVVTLMTAALPVFAQTPAPAPTLPAAPMTASAPTSITTAPASPATATTTIVSSVCDQYPGLSAKISGCIRNSIDTGAATFYAQIYPFLQRSIAAVMTLAVIVYGIMLAYGAVEKVGRDTYIVMMKLAAVAVMCSSSPWIASTVTGIMDGAAAAVVSYAPTGGTADNAGTDFSQSQCMKNMTAQSGNTNLKNIAPWLAVDCLVDTVVGIHITPQVAPANDAPWFNQQLDTDKNQGMSHSLMYLFFCCMQSSILGLIMAIIGAIFIYGLLILIVRCFFVYIAGYMGVTFLAIISPLIIPLILFKETKQYFDKWVRMFISFALQPVIMLVFLIFSIATIDMAVYSGTYSIYYAIAGTQSQQPDFDLNTYLTSKNIVTKKQKAMLDVKADSPLPVPQGTRDAGGTLNNLLFSKCTPDAIKKDPTLQQQCAFKYPISLTQTGIDWEAMASARSPAVVQGTATSLGQAESQNVLSSLFFCLMTVFVLNGVLAVVPMIVGDLLGDLNQSPILGGIGIGGAKAPSGSGVGNALAKANPFKSFAGLIGRK